MGAGRADPNLEEIEHTDAQRLHPLSYDTSQNYPSTDGGMATLLAASYNLILPMELKRQNTCYLWPRPAQTILVTP